jgi:uroporphyrinogen decarboxylase
VRNQPVGKVENVKAALAGEETVPVPFSFWTALPFIDLDPDRLADVTYSFFRENDIDFIKTMPNGMYAVEDYGCTIDYSELETGGVSTMEETPVRKSADWARIEPLSINSGALGREIASLRRLVGKVNGEAPIVATVFSPLTIAQKVSNGQGLEWIRAGDDPAPFHSALDVIAGTVANFCAAVIELGVDGVFFATQQADRDAATAEEYGNYGVPYDKRALEGAREGWFNILHLHGENTIFEPAIDYPVHAINWHVWETPPTISEARTKTDKCLVGGINRRSITNRVRTDIETQIRDAIRQSGGRGHILTPGCGIRLPLDKEVLAFIRERVEAEAAAFAG